MNIKKLPHCVCKQEGWWYVIGQGYLEKEWVKRKWTRKNVSQGLFISIAEAFFLILEWRCMSIVIMAVASKWWSSSIHWILFTFSPHHRSFSSWQRTLDLVNVINRWSINITISMVQLIFVVHISIICHRGRGSGTSEWSYKNQRLLYIQISN